MKKRRMNREQLKAHREKMKAIGIDKESPLYYEYARKITLNEYPNPLDNPEYHFGNPAELNFKEKAK